MGASGMLGTDVVDELASRGHEVVALSRSTTDIYDADAVGRLLVEGGVVVNCAGWTDVDGAETHEDEAFAANAVLPDVLARACRRAGSRLVHLSTDYVFSGTASEPYAVDDPVGPVSAYGRTKLAGEWAVRASGSEHLVVRTAWLYGAAGRCFPRTIAAAARTREHLHVVDDQVGQPTWTRDVASYIVRLVDARVEGGTYHATSSGQVSWHGFARSVVEAAGFDPAMVRPVGSEAFPRPAARPAYSVLDHGSVVSRPVLPIGPWEDRWRAAAGSVLADLD